MMNRTVKRLVLLTIAVLLVSVPTGCSNKLLSEPLDAGDIDQIQVVLAMGNPEYGADSKIITNRSEIEGLVNAFNGATIGDRVRDADLGVSDASRYYLYSEGAVVRQFVFNGNDSERIWFSSRWHYINYPDEKPYDLYRASEAEVIVVDEDLNEMERPGS